MAECLLDEGKPEAERTRWTAGFHRCRATEVLRIAQHKQGKADEKLAKARGDNADPLPTDGRLWFVRPARPDEGGMR